MIAVVDVLIYKFMDVIAVVDPVICLDLRLDPAVHGLDDRLVCRSCASRHRTDDVRIK